MAKTKCFFRFINSEDKSVFSKSRCLFTISVGQQTHEGEHFDATIELINNSFESCVMLVDDSLQRHTMALNQKQNPDYFYDLSIKEGDLWLERNKHYYSKLNNLEKIVRWDYWLSHPDFLKKRKAILETLKKDQSYNISFRDSVNSFVSKYHLRINSETETFDIERAKKLSFDFILEECTALCLWPELNCNFEAYPNLHNSAINDTRQRFVLSKNTNLIQPITLGFRNAKQLKPQHFLCLEDLS